MREAGIEGVSRGSTPTTTLPSANHRKAPDLVDRDFEPDTPNQGGAEITHVPTSRGYLYVAVVLDAFRRRVIGWALPKHLRTELVVKALDLAVERRQTDGVIHRSDQGSQYTSIEFGKRCREANVRPSMGTVGDCYDNTPCESFFASLNAS